MKLTGPMFSLTASGTIGKTIVMATWKGIAYARKHVIPTYSNTTDQGTIRGLFTELAQAWKAGSTIGTHQINTSYKEAYNLAASGMQLSGFNLFVRESIDLNGGTAYTGTLAIRTSPVGV